MAETITINSVVLTVDGAWKLIDPTPFLGQGPFRGSDRVIPGTAGVSARPRVLDKLDVIAPMYVLGRKNVSGTTYGDERIGVKTNVEYLRTNLLTGTSVTITHTFTDASTRTGSCIVNELRVLGARDEGVGRVATVALDITILGGKLT